MPPSIDYGNLMHDAMRGLIQRVLTSIAAGGLPGDHHFFITFETGHPRAEVSDWLAERYPQEMTIVLQHEFFDLDVTDEGFSVTLSFQNKPERLVVPYDAIKTFVDPSVEFGLRFETQEGSDEQEEDAEVTELVTEAHDDASKPRDKDAEIVSLDSFRK
ncbi:MAG: ClpXP protease specificity-enhancing factor SspB [Paracoccaceae bacterium]|nr:ClpXP protease specificity-enhancing factor SspB [Paracoccaceae bacterium]